MTVEEMVKYLAIEAKRDCDDTGIRSACNSIIAALKAGHRMQHHLNWFLSIKASDSLPDDVRRTLTLAAKAWDTATKEDV